MNLCEFGTELLPKNQRNILKLMLPSLQWPIQWPIQAFLIRIEFSPKIILSA